MILLRMKEPFMPLNLLLVAPISLSVSPTELPHLPPVEDVTTARWFGNMVLALASLCNFPRTV